AQAQGRVARARVSPRHRGRAGDARHRPRRRGCRALVPGLPAPSSRVALSFPSPSPVGFSNMSTRFLAPRVGSLVGTTHADTMGMTSTIAQRPIVLGPVETPKSWGKELWLNATRPEAPAAVREAAGAPTLAELLAAEPALLGEW